MLIVYTGNGKGKTTAALGMAIRASGWGKNVIIIQFVKEESWPEGARRAFRLVENKLGVEINAVGTGFVGIMGDDKPKRVHVTAAKKAVRELIKKVKSGKYDLVIADEILGALHGGLLKREDIEMVLSTIEGKDVDLVFTGRNAPAWLVKRADLVTEMREIKHPFSKGVQAKKGIDF